MEDAQHAHIVKFNNAVWALLRMMQKLAKTQKVLATALKAENLYKLALKADNKKVILSSVQYFSDHNDQIETREESYFLSECDKTVGETQQRIADAKSADNTDNALLIDLLSSVKNMYMNANAADKDAAYGHIRDMRDAAIQFGIAYQS